MAKKFCVIGDMIVDHYRVLEATRISPEAPVLIFGLKNEYKVPGGAGNVANNLLGLANPEDKVVLCSIVGWDWPQLIECQEDAFLPCRKVFKRDISRRTTVKERLVTSRQQVARIDLQQTGFHSRDIDSEFCEMIVRDVTSSDVVILSDYNHGVMSEEIVKTVIYEATKHKIPIVVDSKAPDTVKKYRGSTIALPTKQEIAHFEDIDIKNYSDDVELAKVVLDKMELQAIGMTMGKDGIFLATKDGECGHHPALASDPDSEVVDVTGAGDTVTATVALCMAYSMGFGETIRLANVAAGTVVVKSGVVAASKEEVRRAAWAKKIIWPT